MRTLAYLVSKIVIPGGGGDTNLYFNYVHSLPSVLIDPQNFIKIFWHPLISHSHIYIYIYIYIYCHFILTEPTTFTTQHTNRVKLLVLIDLLVCITYLWVHNSHPRLKLIFFFLHTRIIILKHDSYIIY